MEKTCTAEEILEIASHQWATWKDIKKITGMCEPLCKKELKEIKKQAIDDGKFIPNTRVLQVPMELVMEKLNINLSYLKKVAGK